VKEVKEEKEVKEAKEEKEEKERASTFRCWRLKRKTMVINNSRKRTSIQHTNQTIHHKSFQFFF